MSNVQPPIMSVNHLLYSRAEQYPSELRLPSLRTKSSIATVMDASARGGMPPSSGGRGQRSIDGTSSVRFLLSRAPTRAVLNHLSSADADWISIDKVALGTADKSLKLSFYTYLEINTAASLLAAYYALVIPPRAVGDSKTKLTVGLLASSDYDCTPVLHLKMQRLP